jgi:hypothetical protein
MKLLIDNIMTHSYFKEPTGLFKTLKGLCSILALLNLCNKLATQIGTLIRFYFKLFYLFIYHLCNLMTLQIGLFLSLGPNPHAPSISLQPGITIVETRGRGRGGNNLRPAE